MFYYIEYLRCRQPLSPGGRSTDRPSGPLAVLLRAARIMLPSAQIVDQVVSLVPPPERTVVGPGGGLQLALNILALKPSPPVT